MNVVAWIFGIVLVAVFGLAGAAKLADFDRARDRLGYSLNSFRGIGLAEIAAAVAIIMGLVNRSWEYIAIAGAVGLACLMIGALLAHARVEDDAKRIIPPAAMFVVAVLFVIFIAVR